MIEIRVVFHSFLFDFFKKKKICLKLKNGLGLEEKNYKKRDKFPILWYTICRIKSVYILKANDWVRLFLYLNV